MNKLHNSLEQFTKIICDANQANVHKTSDYDYESEALTILSRFNEGALDVYDENSFDEVLEYAQDIVEQTFEFWKSESVQFDVDKLAHSLLLKYSEIQRERLKENK